MDHLGKWYLGFHLYPSIWFGLGGKGFGRSLCVEEIKEKQNWGNRVFSPKFRESEVKWYSAMVCVEEQFWMIRCGLLVQETVKENDDMVCYTLLEVVGFLGCNDSVLVLNGIKR